MTLTKLKKEIESILATYGDCPVTLLDPLSHRTVSVNKLWVNDVPSWIWVDGKSVLAPINVNIQ